MSNYKKDKSYIKQRLEYVSPVDYISELEEKIEYLQQENERLNKTIDTILEYNIFKDECPLNYGYDTKSDEEKAQDIFNEEYCEKCKDDYKKCWLDYFEELKELKEGKE